MWFPAQEPDKGIRVLYFFILLLEGALWQLLSVRCKNLRFVIERGNTVFKKQVELVQVWYWSIIIKGAFYFISKHYSVLMWRIHSFGNVGCFFDLELQSEFFNNSTVICTNRISCYLSANVMIRILIGKKTRWPKNSSQKQTFCLKFHNHINSNLPCQ